MRVLVTGGAGFIGSHLIKYLLDIDYQVVCLDNFFTGSKNNIENFLDNKNFEFVEYDIIEPFELEGEFDQVYNLACPASPIHYQKNAVRTIKTSTVGMINVLGFARKHGARILQASTSEVYGDPLEHPQTEKYLGNVSTIGPRACYDEGKRVAETLMFDYHRMHGMEIRVARIFNTYGPNMTFDDGRVVSNFIVQALKNQAITIYGDGKQTRSFCYVSDLVDGLYKLMESDFQGPVNIGNPDEFTMTELAEKILKLTSSKSELVFKDLPEDDPKQRKPDISLAKEKLDWQPKINLEEGLQKTIDYFKTVI